MRRICVYCGSSSGARADYADAAVELADVLVRHDLELVYGGASKGLMGIIADAVLERGGAVHGVIPGLLEEQEIAHTGLTELHVVASMHERKSMMAALSDGFVALPGGFGTLEEIVEIVTWGQLRFHDKPCGLLNVRGELFVNEARHIPAELPRLSGPKDRSADVARRYLTVREALIPRGLDLRRVHLDPRGAWDMTLHNGVQVRLGRRDVDARTDLFLDIVADIITGRGAEIDYVDMRYSNGFTIGWNNGSRTPVEDPAEPVDEMLALRGGD